MSIPFFFLIFSPLPFVHCLCDLICVCDNYHYDEVHNPLGTYRCSNSDDCQCEGTRRCSEFNWCNSCEDLGNCPANMYFCNSDQILAPNMTACLPCNDLWTGCTSCNSTNCLSCESTRFFINEICVDCVIENCQQCGASYEKCVECESGFALLNSSFCIDCQSFDINCNDCTSSGCLSCNSGFYFSQARNSCIACNSNFGIYCSDCSSSECLNCPSNTYKDVNSVCTLCNTDCLTCSGPGVDECLSCKSSRSLVGSAPAQCKCSSTEFYSTITNSCLACTSPCKTCEGGYIQQCYSCIDGYILLEMGGPTSCGKECLQGYYLNTKDHNCLKCDSSCLNCTNATENSCTSCAQGHFLQNSVCVIGCEAGFYGDGTVNECIKCHSSCQECIGENSTSCTACNSGHYLVEQSNSTSGICSRIQIISPLLQQTKNPWNFELSFPKSNYSGVYKLYQKNSTIKIESLSDYDYNFSIIYQAASDLFILSLSNINASIKNKPTLTIDLNPPTNILIVYPGFALTNYTVQTTVNYYYFMDQSELSLSNITKAMTETMNTVVAHSFFVNNAISPGSFTFATFFFSTDGIKLLRFLDIDYPANAIAIFQANLPTPDIVPNINFAENPSDGILPDTLTNNGVSIYLFNNNGNQLIEATTYWCLGIVVKLFLQIFPAPKQKFFETIFNSFSTIFVWNYSVNYVLANFMSFAFFTVVAYQYPTTHTSICLFNLLYSVLLGLSLILFFPFILIKIKRIRNQLNK